MASDCLIGRGRFLAFLGSAAAWPAAAGAQSARPAVGFLSARSPVNTVAAFRRGLADTGFIDGQTVTLEIRGSQGNYDRLPALAAELVRHPVKLIAASGVTTTRAAMSATSSLPIVFHTGGDPVRLGLVASLNRPGGNLTGVVTMGKLLVPKQLELIHDIVAKALPIAFLVNPNNAAAPEDTEDAQAAARALGRRLLVVTSGSERELETAFATAAQAQAGAVLMQADPLFDGMRDTLVRLASRFALPAISPFVDYAEAGGFASYGSSLEHALQLMGNYAGRILKGEKPADLPVQQTVRIELIVNLRAARALGITLPASVLLRADALID